MSSRSGPKSGINEVGFIAMWRVLPKILKPRSAKSDLPEKLTIGDPSSKHPYEVFANSPIANIIAGMCFEATLQLRTPLRILQRHGQVLPLGSHLPDDFEQWMGIWFPKTKTFEELTGGRIEDKLGPEYEATHASTIGPVKPSEYLPFLMAIREVVEDQSLSMVQRSVGIEAVCHRSEFKEFAEHHGGADEIFDYLYPTILSVIPGLTASLQEALTEMGIRSVGAIRRTSDKTLSSLKGLGPAKIARIRAFCDAYKGDPDAERLMEVEW